MDYVFLKGSALRISSYKFGFKRFTRDIDILVSAKDIHKAYVYMKELGFRYLDRNCSDSTSGSMSYARHIPKMVNSQGIIIELHHRISDPKEFLECKFSEALLADYDVINFSGNRFKIPKKEHMYAHLLHHELSQKKENNIILLISDLKNLSCENIKYREISKFLNDLDVASDFIRQFDPLEIRLGIIADHSKSKHLSLINQVKFLKRRISYIFQIPIEKVYFLTYLSFIKIKIIEKLFKK